MNINLNKAICNTSGDGFWSREKKSVILKNMKIDEICDDDKYGELCVYFDSDSWNTEKDGLIYTDRLFISEFRTILQNLGFSKEESNNANYSEQGMQGDNFVSMDVGEKFLQRFKILLNR